MPSWVRLIAVTLLVSLHHTEGEASEPDRSVLKQCQRAKECLLSMKKKRKCDVLPIPSKSFILPVPFGTFQLTKLRSGVWMYNDGTYLSLIANVGKHLVMIDFPDSLNSRKQDGSMTRLTDAAEQVLDGTTPKRIDLIYSHAHFDHIASVVPVKKYLSDKFPSAAIRVWGTEEARKLIENSVTKRAIIPDIYVGKPGRTLRMGKTLLLRMEIIGGHTISDLLLYFPRTKGEPPVAMYVDTIFPGWSPPFDLGLSEDVGQYIAAHKQLLKMDIEILVPGHLVPASKRDVARSLKFVEDLVDAAKVAMNRIPGEPISEIGIQEVSDPTAPEFGNLWYAFLTRTRELQIDICERIMLEKWGCKLAGMDITARGNCFAALTYLILDY